MYALGWEPGKGSAASCPSLFKSDVDRQFDYGQEKGGMGMALALSTAYTNEDVIRACQLALEKCD